MSFEQANLNYASEYSQAMDLAYPYLSYFPEIWNSPIKDQYKPGEGKTVYIPSMTVKGAHDADRDNLTGVFTRNHNNELIPVTLEMDREWEDLVDPMDIQETRGVVNLANISKVYNETQKVPEMDAYLAAKLGSFATPDTEALTAANILTKWDSYLEAATENRVPLNRMVAYMTPAVYTMLKNAAGITRFLSVAGPGGVNRNISTLDDVRVKAVPSNMMKSSYVFTDGWAPAANAKQINLILVDPLAVAAPIKYDTVMISAPTAHTKGKYLYYERHYYGAFMLPKKTGGVIVNRAD